MSEPSDDRLAEKREEKRIPIEMWVEEQRGEDTYFQRSANLSTGGIYLDGTIPHPRGTLVQLKFTLPGEADAICVRGEIVGEPGAEHLGMHVKFLDLKKNEALLARVKAFVEKGKKPSVA
jgi:hypothetical protein